MVSDLCAATTLVAVALWRTHERDPEQLGHWLDFAVLLILGFVVEFRRFEPAWPAHLGAFNRIILFDAGLYGFMIVRQLSHVGFDLRPRFSDWKNGIRELVLYAPIAVPIGLALGFLHLHAEWPGIARVVGLFVSIFFVIAILEETYFRGWRQNLLERRYGRPEHCWLRLSYSDCRTSTRAQPCSTGGTSSWLHWQASSTAGDGDRNTGFSLQLSPMLASTQYGYCGCAECVAAWYCR